MEIFKSRQKEYNYEGQRTSKNGNLSKTKFIPSFLRFRLSGVNDILDAQWQREIIHN